MVAHLVILERNSSEKDYAVVVRSSDCAEGTLVSDTDSVDDLPNVARNEPSVCHSGNGRIPAVPWSCLGFHHRNFQSQP